MYYIEVFSAYNLNNLAGAKWIYKTGVDERISKAIASFNNSKN
jgi:hypothetical protein